MKFCQILPNLKKFKENLPNLAKINLFLEKIQIMLNNVINNVLLILYVL